MKDIAAIMMTDIVGFTKLTRQTESLVREVSTKHKNTLQTSISRLKSKEIIGRLKQ